MTIVVIAVEVQNTEQDCCSFASPLVDIAPEGSLSHKGSLGVGDYFPSETRLT